MTSAKEIYRSLRGAARPSKLAVLAAIGAALALVLIVSPALAGSGGPSGSGIQPDEVSYGGGSGACSANLPGLPSAAPHELHINNPSDGTFTGPDGTQISIDVKKGDKMFDFELVNQPNNAVFDVIVNGGSMNTHFDYDEVGAFLRSDTELHAPTRSGNRLFKLSHINFCYGVKPFADLSVTKTPQVTTANVFDIVEFEIVVENAGPADATGVEVTDSLPAGVAFESASDGGTFGNGEVTWSGLSIASGQSKTLSVSVEILRAAGGVSLFNDVAITYSDQEDGDPGNNEAASYPAIEVSVPVADLSVTKVPVGQEEGDFVANVGDDVTFEIEVFNSSSSTIAAFDVEVTDTLPTGMDFKSASDSGAHSDGIVTWEIDGIPIGESVKLTLVVTINGDAAGQVVKNSVSVSAPDDPEGDNNDDAESVPPVTVTADVEGTKFHDRDTDGGLDLTEEEGLSGWVIAAFDDEGVLAGTGTTDLLGAYTIANLQPGTYTICEEVTEDGLPDDGTGFVWTWTQSQPSNSTEGVADCSTFSGEYEALGYSVEVDGDIIGVDFGNHTQVSISCDAEVIVTLGGEDIDDNPFVTVTVPAGTPSCSDGQVWTTTFDVGRSDIEGGDPDFWSQFYVFGGLPTEDAMVMDLVTVWDAEEASYVDGSLVVPTTQVQIEPGGDVNPLVLCSSDVGLPDMGTPLCLDSRTIAEGGGLPAGQIQVTEHNKLLGDPRGFR